MDTVFSWAANIAMEDAIERDPRTLKVIYDFQKKVRNGEISSQIMEELGQPFYGYEKQCSMYCALRLYGEILTGNLWRTEIDLGFHPSADKEVAANNDVLSRLPPNWKAEFLGGNSDNDGFVEWSLPVTGRVLTENSFNLITFDSGRAPLEVGYTEYWTTLSPMERTHCCEMAVSSFSFGRVQVIEAVSQSWRAAIVIWLPVGI